MAKRKGELDSFLDEVRAESQAAGSEALEALTSYGEHFRLARQIILLRKMLSYTQQELSRASGVQQSEISRIERGQGNPTYRTLESLARVANLTVALVPRPTVPDAQSPSSARRAPATKRPAAKRRRVRSPEQSNAGRARRGAGRP